MAVGIEGDGDGGVPKHLGDDLRVDVPRQQERGAGVAKIVEADARASLREPGPLQEPGERAAAKVRGVDDAAGCTREDEPAGCIEGAYR